MNTAIKAYDPFRAQIGEIKEANRNMIFDYAEKDGNAAARSHIYKLRQCKSAIDKARQEEKAASLEYGRKVDAEAKALIAEVQEMIDYHQKPLDEIEQREKERVTAITQAVEAIIIAGQNLENIPSENLRIRIAALEPVPTEEQYQEFLAVANKERDVTLARLKTALTIAEKREADAAELEALRKEKEDRDAAEAEAQRKRDEEARIEKAKAEAVEKERAESARREQEANDRAAKAEQDAKNAAENERKRLEQAEADRVAAEEKRAADRAHQATVHGQIIVALDKLGVNEELSKAVITAILRGEVPHIRIQY